MAEGADERDKDVIIRSAKSTRKYRRGARMHGAMGHFARGLQLGARAGLMGYGLSVPSYGSGTLWEFILLHTKSDTKPSR